MNRRRARTLLIHAARRAEQIEPDTNAPQQPYVGIWWAAGGLVVAILQSLDRAERSGPLLDSTLTHVNAWPAVAGRFNCSRDSVYFAVPRGRVLLERKSGCGVIYHGNETCAETLRRIARAFKLTDWRSEIDEHYLMGDEADRLFDEDF